MYFHLTAFGHKRIISSALYAVVLFCLVSCGGSSSGPVDPQHGVVVEVASEADLQFGRIEDDLGDISSWMSLRNQVSMLISDYLGDGPGGTAGLEPLIVSEEILGDHIRKKVSYKVSPDERINAYLLLPFGVSFPRPAILALHQTVEQGMREPIGLQGDPSMAYGLELVRRGYVVLAPDTITAGERLGPGEAYYDTAVFYLSNPNWSAMGKMLWDHQRGIDFLQSLPEVNPDRIGVIGHSLGGYNALFLAAFDERIQAVVASCPYTRIQTDPGKERWSRLSGFIHFPKLRPYVAPGSLLKVPWDFHHVLSLIAPRPLFQSVALNDAVFPNTTTVAQIHMFVLPLYKYVDGEKDLVTIFHQEGHGFPYSARMKAYEFIDNVLWPSPEMV